MRTAQQRKTLACFRHWQEEKRSTCDQVIRFSLILCGTVASSAVSSVLYSRDAAGNHAETRTGAYIHCGDAASFHAWEFRTRLRITGKSGDHYIEAMSKVCDGLRGDAFVAAQEVGFDNLCAILDGRPSGVDTLINHMRGMFFPRLNTSPKNYYASIVVQVHLYQGKTEKVRNSMSRGDEVAGHP